VWENSYTDQEQSKWLATWLEMSAQSESQIPGVHLETRSSGLRRDDVVSEKHAFLNRYYLVSVQKHPLPEGEGGGEGVKKVITY